MKPNSIGRWVSASMSPWTFPRRPYPEPRAAAPWFRRCGAPTIAAIAVGCGEADEEKAQNQVCDARADIDKQVNELAALAAATATTESANRTWTPSKTTSTNQGRSGRPQRGPKAAGRSANQEFSSPVRRSRATSVRASLSGAEAELGERDHTTANRLQAEAGEDRLRLIENGWRSVLSCSRGRCALAKHRWVVEMVEGHG